MFLVLFDLQRLHVGKATKDQMRSSIKRSIIFVVGKSPMDIMEPIFVVEKSPIRSIMKSDKTTH